MIPLCVLIGINRLIEVAFDYLIRCGLFMNNPAGALSAERFQKTGRNLPYTHIPIVVSEIDIDVPGTYDTFKPVYDISIPIFPDLSYLGGDAIDGISNIRRFLIDELENNPWLWIETNTSNFKLGPGQKLVILELYN